ncbi:MAG: RNA polymerase sigma factor [Planctomycetota bacterium]|jgi:RNA polymerase sigma-70 factor (ECF subfamily)
MDTHAAKGRFPTTSWTRIRRSIASQEELGTLLSAYWGPVYAYIRRRGHRREAAADLTQGFLTQVLLERDLLASADQELGSFRSYLLTALGHYVIDEYRREHGRTGQRPSVTVPGEQEILESAEPDQSDDPVQAFDRQWATTTLDLASQRVETDCRRRGLDAHWAIYEARILRPACSGCRPLAVDELARTHGVREADVYSMLNTVKRKIRNALDSIIIETLEDPEDLGAELAELSRVLSLSIA